MVTMTLDADDQEIIEIFVEEAEEVLQEIGQNLKALKVNPRDRTALGEVRRGFHTLKGSGRMAKALDVGELAWKVENMLNRAIEGKIEVSEPLLRLLTSCHAAMPKLVDAFKRQRPSGTEVDMETMLAEVDALTSGQTRASPAPRTAPAVTGDPSAIQSRLQELQRQFEQATRRTDEALQRAEMGLQQSRKLAQHLDLLQSGLEEYHAKQDIKPLTERVNSLSRDILELRELTRGGHAQAGAAPDARELQHLIDQRLRDRAHASERSRQELEQRVDEVLQTALSAQRLGLWALVIGILLTIAATGTAAYLFL